ncbi:MAG: hypothetical protein JKY08_06245, partial [Flavobacteriaceae bacterium]|nr:hypothetical protein [Flavobacteriaceae bacterium]
MKKNYFLRNLLTSILLTFCTSLLVGQNVNDCIIITNPTADITVCADVFAPEIGADVLWSPPTASQTCSGGDGNFSFEMLFERPENELSQGCWNFHYLSRVGTDGGYVKLFSGNHPDNNNTQITTPSLYMQQGNNVAIDVTYADGNYDLLISWIDENNNTGPIPAVSTDIDILGVGTHTISVDPQLPSDGIYRIVYTFVYTGGKPSNSNQADTIQVNGNLLSSSNCSAGVDFTFTGSHTPGDFFPVGSTIVNYIATYTGPSGSVITKSHSFTVTVINITFETPNIINPSCNTTGSIALTTTGGTTPITYTLNPGGQTNTTGSFSNLSAGNYTITATDNTSLTNCSKTSEIITLTELPNDIPSIIGSLTLQTIEGCSASDLPSPVNTLAGLELLEGSIVIIDNQPLNGTLTVSSIDNAPSGTCPIIITRTYTVTDDCGKYITIDQIFEIVDTTDPTASNPVAINIECIEDLPAPNIEVVLDEADNCNGPVTVAFVNDLSDGN